MVDPDPYLTAAAAKERDSRLNDLDDDDIETAIAGFESIAERARGVAFTPRERTIAARRWRPGVVRLADRQVRSVSAVVVDGVTQAGPTLGTLWPDQLGDLLELATTWTCGRTTTVTYSHGLDEPPAPILDACTEYALSLLRMRRSGVSRNTLSEATEAGTTRYSTPDWPAGRFTGWLEVDRLLNSVRDYRTPGLA